MVKIKIKIQDFFERLNFEKVPTVNNKEISFKIPPVIKVLTPDGKYTVINELIKKLCDSYKVKFSNGIELICSDEHILITNNGEKYVKDISLNDDVIFLHDKCKEHVKLISCELYKKDDVLYDICLDYPNLYIDSNGLVHHNSLILSYIWKSLYENNLIEKQLIIVPNISLTEQFRNDWIDYGVDENLIGEVWADAKEWDKDVVVSTWQSLQNDMDKLEMFDSVFVDECHQSQAQILTDILKQTPNAKWRIGCTGTLPDGKLQDYNVRSFLGPVVAEYPASYLIEHGYISDIEVTQYRMHYETRFSKDFNEAKKEIFQNQFRLYFIKNLILNVNKTCLVLVGKVADEGDYLKEFLEQFDEFKDFEIAFISGRMKKAQREEWRKKASDPKNKIILIATYPVFQAGVNVPVLGDVIFGAPYKSKIRILQSIGRALRLHPDKGIARIHDIVDLNNKWFEKQGDIRYIFYQRESFKCIEQSVYEKKFDISKENKQLFFK